jgi:hypothetical protein
MGDGASVWAATRMKVEQASKRTMCLSCKQRISRAASVTNFIRMSDATPRGLKHRSALATDWLSARHAICKPRVVMTSERWTALF